MPEKNHKNKVKYNPFNNITINKNDISAHKSILHPCKNPQNMIEASYLYKGNTQRMKKLIRNANAGEKINIVVLGGSITEGSGMSDGNYYGDVLNRWFKAKYPNNEICFTNAGKGTTTSLFGSARIERDILPLNPDLIIIEYAVNDIILEDRIAREAFEAVVKRLLLLPSEPCVFILLSCMGDLGSAQELDIPIGVYYEVPMASFKDAIVFHLKEMFGKNYESEMTENQISDYVIKNFIYDGCHPNTYGYQLLCDFITYRLLLAEKELDVDEEYIIPTTPLYSDRFVTAAIQNNKVLRVTKNSQWEKADRDDPYMERGFITSVYGAFIEFEFDCKILIIVSRRSISPKYGVVTVKIDDKEPITIDGYFHNGWGTYNDYKLIIDECESKIHRVLITFNDVKSNEIIEKSTEYGIKSEDIALKFIISEFLIS
ncbi:MAG: SGNH/GDSL hydrolase family protein [Clostridia bacterium]